MADCKCINPAELRLLGLHINEIGSACEVMKKLAVKMTEHVRPNGGFLNEGVIVFAEKAGWLADECARILKTSEGPVVGAWEDWALSPAAKEALNALNIAPVDASQAADGSAPR